MWIAVGVVVALLVLLVLASAIKVLREYERAVVFRLGRLQGVRGPGLILLIPMIDRMVRVDLRTVTLDVPPQDVITRDNVSVKVNAVIYFRVVDAPRRRGHEVENYLHATSPDRADDAALRAAGRPSSTSCCPSARSSTATLQKIIDEQTEPWGVKVGDGRDQGRRAARRRCSARWPARPRPSASAARR